MKVLIVCSGNSGMISSIIQDQAESLKRNGVSIDFFLMKGKGILGYLKNLPALKKKINAFNPDLIHAHYGLSGLLATMQPKKKVVITFHGSDINVKNNVKYSYLAARLSKENIFVHPDLPKKIRYSKKSVNIIPCGVDLKVFYPDKSKSDRSNSAQDNKEKKILFASRFANPVKNYTLASNAVELLTDNVKLIELKGYTRSEVNLLMNSVDLLLVTSNSETGPLVVKEAMACNCPIVSTNVGDVRKVVGDTEGCYITTFEPEDVAEKIKLALNFSNVKGRTEGRKRIIDLELDSENVAKRVISVYEQILGKR